MRPPSKHGLERKFKPWRKGKSSSENSKARANTNNASLKNRLRGQRRLLAKLEQNDGNNGGNESSNKETIDGVQQSIHQLERDIAAYESREREKKNAAKYHQVKFIERQKLTRLEKSIKRQLHNFQQQSSNNDQQNKTQSQSAQLQISRLKQQLRSVAMDQLYIAFYPTNRKYIALFASGTNRVADDERGRTRRRGAWDEIRRGLLQESQKSGGGVENNDDRAKEGTRSGNSKKWVFDLDAAKQALLSMPAGEYPNEDHSDAATASEPGKIGLKKNEATKKRRGKSAIPINAVAENSAAATTASDDRFALSKELNGLFHESTTGHDYQKELKSKESDGRDDDQSTDSSSSESHSSSSEKDDADPLNGFGGKKKKVHSGSANVAKQEGSSSFSSSSSSAPSSSSDDSSSDSGSDGSSDSDAEVDPEHEDNKNKQESDDDQEKEEDDGHDDFFAAAKVSTEDVFAQVQKNQKEKGSKHFDDGEMPYGKRRRPDKSSGFKSQNQSKRGYRDFQNRQKRQKWG